MVASRSTPPDVGPVRTCVGCRGKAAKRELLRVTVGSDADGQPAVVPDPRATAPGRGAHLHPTAECYELAVRRKAFGRALRVGPGVGAAPVGEHLQRVEPPAPRDDRDTSDDPGTGAHRS